MKMHTVELEKIGPNNWNVVERDGYGNIVRVERNRPLWLARESKKEWIKLIKEEHANEEKVRW
jgi:hypothetical protein